MTFRFLLACALFAVACTGTPADSQWIGSWGASPVPPREAIGPFPASPRFHNQTIRQTIRLSAGGDHVRVRFTNEYGADPLEIGAATIARADADGKIRPGTMHSLTFGGLDSAMIPAGTALSSDPVEFAVGDLESLSIALYLPADTGPCTCHPTGLQTALISQPGDFTNSDFPAADTMQMRAFLSRVDVYPGDTGQAIVTLGDSITDGLGSTPDTNRRWPDRLAERLVARDDGVSWGVVNAGISGNRVLSDGAGESLLARFERDVLAVPGVTHVIVFAGINDIGFHFGPENSPVAAIIARLPPGNVTAETLIAAYKRLISRARSRGIRIYGATIAPYKGAAYYSAEGEALRQRVNEWIRGSGAFDAVLDFDAVLRDVSDTATIAEGLHNGDFLHGSISVIGESAIPSTSRCLNRSQVCSARPSVPTSIIRTVPVSTSVR
jgi:lysophospholipase L1-like esterase